MKETKYAGMLLLVGAIIILVTIVFELRIGWIGVDRSAEQIPIFIFEKWQGLSKIWGWQGVGYGAFTISFLLFLKNSKGLISIIWALLILSGTIQVIAMGITIGSYYPALQILEEQPALFASIRGAVRSIYIAGQMGVFSITLIFLFELFTDVGCVKKNLGFFTLGSILLTIIIGLITGVQFKVTGATWFFIPLVLGYSYWRNSGIEKEK